MQRLLNVEIGVKRHVNPGWSAAIIAITCPAWKCVFNHHNVLFPLWLLKPLSYTSASTTSAHLLYGYVYVLLWFQTLNRIFCRSCAQHWHCSHLRERWLGGCKGRVKYSLSAAAPPAVSLSATQRSIYPPAFWCNGWETAACTKVQNIGFLLVFSHFCSIYNPFSASEVLLEHHLEDILNHNRQAVLSALQTELRNTLKAQSRRKKVSL